MQRFGKMAPEEMNGLAVNEEGEGASDRRNNGSGSLTVLIRKVSLPRFLLCSHSHDHHHVLYMLYIEE
jgi:hypothetical protein